MVPPSCVMMCQKTVWDLRKEVDFRAKAVSLSDSLCALLMRALTSRKVLHLLLHGCNSIKMWSKVEVEMQKRIAACSDVEADQAEVYGCMTTAAFLQVVYPC